MSTFAISLQLFPASLICFNVCSSFAVHGVFVRPFFTTGCCGGGSRSAPGAVARPYPLDAAAADGAMGLASKSEPMEDFRFLEFPGVGGGPNAETLGLAAGSALEESVEMY